LILPDTKKLLKYTNRDIQAFLKKLGGEEFRSKQNYFRWLEYPWALTAADVKDGDRILEIGSGYLNALPLFLASKYNVTVTATDIGEFTDDSRDYINTLIKKFGIEGDRLRVMQADASNLPFADGSFDVVLCISTLEHVPFYEDSLVAKEIGRVLAPGGRAIISFPFNHHGEHIESESWRGEDYAQRHYNEYTTRWRVVAPSGLWFKSATVFGEIDKEVGKRYLQMDLDAQLKFCKKNAANWQRFWRIYYQMQRDEFFINDDEIPNEIAQAAGLIGLKLEKRAENPDIAYFHYDPFEFYLQNNMLCKTPETADPSLTIDKVRIMNGIGNDMDVFESGQSCWVQIHFTCYGEVINPAFRVVFHDRFGNIIAGLNTYHAGCDFGHLRGEHVLTIKYGMLNLQGGAYEVSVGAWEYDTPNPIPPYPFEIHYRKYSITVKDRMGGLFGAAYTPYELDMK
jgi:SAM-dependent methyltransferase